MWCDCYDAKQKKGKKINWNKKVTILTDEYDSKMWWVIKSQFCSAKHTTGARKEGDHLPWINIIILGLFWI